LYVPCINNIGVNLANTSSSSLKSKSSIEADYITLSNVCEVFFCFKGCTIRKSPYRFFCKLIILKLMKHRGPDHIRLVNGYYYIREILTYLDLDSHRLDTSSTQQD
jgi:hypothetical protein